MTFRSLQFNSFTSLAQICVNSINLSPNVVVVCIITTGFPLLLNCVCFDFLFWCLICFLQWLYVCKAPFFSCTDNIHYYAALTLILLLIVYLSQFAVNRDSFISPRVNSQRNWYPCPFYFLIEYSLFQYLFCISLWHS